MVGGAVRRLLIGCGLGVWVLGGLGFVDLGLAFCEGAADVDLIGFAHSHSDTILTANLFLLLLNEVIQRYICALFGGLIPSHHNPSPQPLQVPTLHHPHLLFLLNLLLFFP